jgi:hypothetical protein
MTEDEKQLRREKEQYWQNIEIVQPGEEFLLFDPGRNRTQARFSDDHTFAGMKSSIRLETGLFGKLHISISAAPYTKERYAVITPFDREQGYPLDKDDLSLHTRLIKIRKMKRELAKTIQGLNLLVFVTYADIASNGMLHALLQENPPSPASDRTSILRHLFLTLNFPRGSSFTARASFNPHRGLLLFAPFFPSDMGPLPNTRDTSFSSPKNTGGRNGILNDNAKRGEDISEGFDVLLPFDQAKLQTIRARFLFLPNLDAPSTAHD